MDSDAVAAIREATNGSYVLGSERFRNQIAEMLRRRVTRGSPGRPRRTETRGTAVGEIAVWIRFPVVLLTPELSSATKADYAPPGPMA